MQPRTTEVEPGQRWVTESEGWRLGAFFGRLHPTHAWLETGGPDGSRPVGADDVAMPADVLRLLSGSLAAACGAPLAVKAVPGTDLHARLSAAGATPYQQCPPSQVDGTEPENRAWAQRPVPAGLEVDDLVGLSDEQVLELWLTVYTWVHAGWSPVADPERAREIFAPMLSADLDRAASVLVRRVGDGTAVAVAFALAEPSGEVAVVVEAVDPQQPQAREAVEAAMRAVVRGAGTSAPLLFDGHVDDPHYPAVLATVPVVTGRGLDLLQIGTPDMLVP